MAGTHQPGSAVPASSADLAAAIGAAKFDRCAATVVGYGLMGKQYVAALRRLGVPRIHVCSRSPEKLEELRGVEGVTTQAGGFERLEHAAIPGELGIVATPTLVLVEPSEALASRGFRKLLIEKPVSLSASPIERLAEGLERAGVEAVTAYNRVAYPSFHEVAARAAAEGGITSCHYTFTEFSKRYGPGGPFPDEELARWGIANSLHPIGMAHGLIGAPQRWAAHRAGAISWHPSGAVFVGSGISDRAIAFSYHADWGSTGRWSVEVHADVSSYRLCPLEQAFRRTAFNGAWDEIPVTTFAPDIKTGFVEQVAAMLDDGVRALIPLVSLRQAAALTRYAESVFGYGAA